MLSLKLDIWSILLGFGALNGYLLALLLWTHHQGKKQANRILALLLFCISLFITELMISRTEYYFDFSYLIMSTFPAAYLIGPLFYFYVKSLLEQKFRFRVSDAVHLIPLLPALISLISFYFFDSAEKVAYIQQFSNPSGLSFRHLLLGGIFIAQVFVYLGLVLRMLSNYQRQYKESASGTHIYHLEWLQRLVLVFGLFIILNAIVSSLLVLGKIFLFPGVVITMFVLSLVTHIVGYHAIRHPQRLFPELQKNQKYAKSSLREKERKKRLKELLRYMEKEKPFLKSDLNLQTLAEDLDLPTDHISQTINGELSLNFYDFVNQYRVKEAKVRLIDPKNEAYSILGIALDSGFNSKASFNRVFKKQVGMTPSQYILKNSMK